MPLALRACARHLTIVPLPYDAREATLPPVRTLPWFPVVGALLGGVLWSVLHLPLPALPRAALALAVWTVVTGGLHEDGLMDAADAAFAVVPARRPMDHAPERRRPEAARPEPRAPAERRLEILKDPHVGAHAATAGALLMLLRFAALTVVLPAAVVAAPIIGRWCMTLTLALLRPARTSGLGAAFASRAHWLPATAVALALLAGCTALTPPLAVLGATLAGAATALATGCFLVRRFGGASGDVHGAAGVLAETAALYGFLVVQ